MRALLLLLPLLFLTIACETRPTPEPIEYGKDSCEFCRMIIADAGFAAELKTKKGKVYKFDSIECLAAFVLSGRVRKEDILAMWVSDFAHKGRLIRVERAKFLVSDRLRSPMGLNISAYESEEDLKKFRAWKGLMERDERAYLHLWTLFKDVLPSWELYLKDKERYLANFYSDTQRWKEALDEKTRTYAEHYPRQPVHLTTMHSQKGEEGDVVWVSGRWTKKIKVSDEERKLYFTACTRTKDVLVVDKQGWHNIKKLL